jgi:transposase
MKKPCGTASLRSATVAEIGDWKTFSSGRSLAAWIGLVPNQIHRRLLVVGAMAVIRSAQARHRETAVAWPADGAPSHESGGRRAR